MFASLRVLPVLSYFLVVTISASALNLSINPNISFSTSISNLNAIRIYCEVSLGEWQDSSSCIDAMEQMPTGNRILSFGVRGLGPVDVPLPQVYVSSKFVVLPHESSTLLLICCLIIGDGVCLITTVIRRDRTTEHAKLKALKNGVQDLIRRCSKKGDLCGWVRSDFGFYLLHYLWMIYDKIR